MKRLLGICLFIIVVVWTLGVMAVRASLREFRLRNVVFVNCHSDRLSLFEYPLREWAQTNGNAFPSASEFLKSSLISNYAFCQLSEAPLVWNPRLNEISLTSEVPKALAWCPLGSHERFTCALIAEKGKVTAQVIEWNRLSELLATNSPR